MRYSHYRAAMVVASLAQLPAKEGHATGKEAFKLTEAEACKFYSRAERAQRFGSPMTLNQIVSMSGRRARARVTHPHKRGKK